MPLMVCYWREVIEWFSAAASNSRDWSLHDFHIKVEKIISDHWLPKCHYVCSKQTILHFNRLCTHECNILAVVLKTCVIQNYKCLLPSGSNKAATLTFFGQSETFSRYVSSTKNGTNSVQLIIDSWMYFQLSINYGWLWLSKQVALFHHNLLSGTVQFQVK